MADEIKLKAPTVEQQVVVNINGEEKLRSFADTLEKISNNKNLQKYWKTQQELINATADAYGNFSKKASQDNAKELIKVTNALKAMSGTDLSNILPDFDKVSKAMAEAQKVAGNIDSAFSVKGFKEAFESFETIRAYGVDIQNLFSHFGVSSDVGELQQNVRALESEVEKLTRRLTNAKNANEELRNEFDNFKSGSGFADKLDELDNLKYEMSNIREQAKETFKEFLKLNNVSESGYTIEGWDNNRFKEYFDNIQSGYYTASDAIRQFKAEYAYLLEEGFKSNNDTFGLEQLQAFSNKLDLIFRQVEETSTKINDIISNGVITKSVENLSMDSSLSDSQRSLFGNLLKDEESLKSITALFQKLIEESNKTSKVDLVNDKQLQQILSIFDKIENHLSSLRSIISDVGDGEEFSPLIKALNDVKEAASNIKLNFNMDLGDEVSERLNQKVSQASARQLEAYRNLLSAMKGTGKTNKEMFQFFEPDDASVTELIGIYKGIIERAEKQFKVGNSNIYKKYLGSEYDALKREVTNANKQLSRADSKRSENGILGDLFGNTKDLSEVIEQLNKIIKKLDEISKSALEFKSTFKEGFNVTASVEEIDKLTNRVKELEDELSKIKLNPVNVDKSNISSENSIRSVLPSDSEFKNVIANLDLTKSKLGEIVKITRQAHADKDGKFYESFTLTDRYGSTETYGESSKTSKGQLLNYKYVEQNAKAAEQEAKALNQAWEEANKVNNALNETKNTLSSLLRMTELDTQFSSLDVKLSSLNSELTSGKISVADYKQEVKSLTSEYSKLVTVQQNRDVETYKQNAKDAEQEAKVVKEVWDKNVKAIQDYMDAVTKLNNLNAKDKGSGKYSSQIALQEKNVEELKRKALEARTAITSMINPHDVPLNTWRDYLDVMEKFSQASLGSAESVAKLEDALRKMDFSSLESASTKFESQFNNLSIKPDGDHQFLSWTNNLKELNAKIDEYNSKVKYLKENNIVDGEQVKEVKKLRDEIEETINVMTKTPQAKRGWTDIGASKAAEKVANVLKQNTKMSKEARDAIRAYYNELRSGNPSQPIDEILVKVNQLVQKERELGRVGKSFGEIFKEKVIYGGAAQLAGMVGFYDLINVGREGFNVIKDLDSAYTEMRKVSDETAQSLKNFQSASFDVAKQVGVTALEIQNSTADFMRLGYSLKEASKLSEDANIYANVGDMDISEATEHMISSIQAWKSEFSSVTEASTNIIDRYNEVNFLPLCA